MQIYAAMRVHRSASVHGACCAVHTRHNIIASFVVCFKTYVSRLYADVRWSRSGDIWDVAALR